MIGEECQLNLHMTRATRRTLVEYGVDYIGILYMNVVPSSGIAADEFSPYIAPGAVDAYDGSADDPYREK